MKTNAIAASAIIGLVILGAATVTFATRNPGPFTNPRTTSTTSSTSHSTSTTTSTCNSTASTPHNCENEDDENENEQGVKLNFAAGTTITFTNLNGHWVALTHTTG